jgi:hypothetical protein
MTYGGHIKNGVAVIDSGVTLPDGTPVRVEVESQDSGFWNGKSVNDLAKEQGTQPLSNLSDLAINWPTEDSVEDLLAMVREVRC